MVALEQRYEAAKRAAIGNAAEREFLELEEIVKTKSCVVISMPIGAAHLIFSDPRQIYRSYDELVGTARRTPAASSDDKARRAVDGILYGSYQDEIRFGVLALECDGLPTYGELFCRVKAVAIERRVTFLDENSYNFVVRHGITIASPIPVGYRASWANRHLLTMAKVGAMLRPGTSLQDWRRLIVQTDGKHRDRDDFIEAAIYGSINSHSFDQLVPAPGKRLKAVDRVIRDSILARFDSTQ